MFCMALGSLRPTLREYDSVTGLGRVMLRSNLLSGKPGGVRLFAVFGFVFVFGARDRRAYDSTLFFL